MSLKLTIQNVHYAVIDHFRDICWNVAAFLDPVGKEVSTISKGLNELLQNGQVEGGLQEFPVLTPLSSTTGDQSLAQEVVHESVDEYLVSVFFGRQHALDVFRFQRHEYRNH